MTQLILAFACGIAAFPLLHLIVDVIRYKRQLQIDTTTRERKQMMIREGHL